MINIDSCPVCGSTKQQHFITCTDHTVSKEQFNIMSCNSCNFRFTSPRPADQELGKYYKSEDYISHSNTSKGIISKLYHLVRNYTLGKKEEMLSGMVSRGTLLDYGCGTGMFLKRCKDLGWKVYGMEPDEGARGIGQSMGLKVFTNKSALNSEITDGSLNAITLWHVLEHVTDLPETLNFFKAKLARDGALVIAVPNYTSYDAKKYSEFWAAYDVPRHLYHFEKQTISKLLSSYGFKLVETKPMKFDSFYVSMLSEKYKTGSINYFKAFISGLLSNLKAKSPTGYSSVIYAFKKA